ncbi:MAG: hypothetical protein ACXVP0_11070, partial [Bacteroidia bacterium]
LAAQLESAQTNSEQVTEWENKYTLLSAENGSLSAQIGELTGIVSGFKTEVESLNSKIESYEQEIVSLKNSSKTSEDQDEFIDRLFKQIDALNDERLTLLNEKEAMASQLLKMNDVIGGLSQQIDSQHINVSDLNNHRKNVILATSSDNGPVNERTVMKKQINELVREIDKCIALLSA